MAGMAKAQMTPEQAADREVAIALLTGAGWGETQRHINFDRRGFWAEFQVEMEREASGMQARVEVRFDERMVLLDLTVEDSGDGLSLEVECEDQVLDFLRLLVAGQDGLTPKKYKAEVRKLYALCPKMFRWVDDERLPVRL